MFVLELVLTRYICSSLVSSSAFLIIPCPVYLFISPLSPFITHLSLLLFSHLKKKKVSTSETYLESQAGGLRHVCDFLFWSACDDFVLFFVFGWSRFASILS
jgi:hypothetical protein